MKAQLIRNKLSRIKTQGVVPNPFFPKNYLNQWNVKKPGLAVFDADGTIIKMAGGDHWFTIINKLPPEVIERIKNRVTLVGKSPHAFEQQYLSASSLFEFGKNGWKSGDLKNFAKDIHMREGVAEVFNTLLRKGWKIVVISHGIKFVIQEFLTYCGFEQIEVIGNELYDEKRGLIAPSIKNYTPTFERCPDKKHENKKFLSFVSSMQVTPRTKAALMKNYIEKHAFADKRVMAIGDSEGDLGLFKVSRDFNGLSLLHIHSDKAHHNVPDAEKIELFANSVTHFCINNTDASFKPTANEINNLL